MAVSGSTLIKSWAGAGNFTSSGAQAATASAGVGTLLIAVVASGGGNRTLGFSDSAGNTWTALNAFTMTSGAQLTGRIFHTVVTSAITSGVTTFTATTSTSSGLCFSVEAFTGAGAVGTQVTDIETTNVNTTSSPAVPCTADGLLFSCLVTNDAVTGLTGNGSLVEGVDIVATASSNNRRLGTYHQQIAATGDVTPSISFSGSSQSYGMASIPVAAEVAVTRRGFIGLLAKVRALISQGVGLGGGPLGTMPLGGS